MLVVFTNKSGGTVEMFEKVALQMIKLMGRREAIPSAISKEDLPKALAQLKAELARLDPPASQDQGQGSDDDDEPKSIGLSTRAFPLIELIEHTIHTDSFLMWDYS
ncbi:MAG: hypothetical protein CSB47_01935 [Proteobacteria bacterium]|nr:MAG: hypothetical protein CSB47_01935 [Pseudomonadota bacterium]